MSSYDIFLICGDRAWKEFQVNPCTFGCLTMFHPSNQALVNWTLQHRRSRCAAVQFDSDCNPHIDFWNHAQRFFGFLIPSIGTAHALTTLNKLGCWLAKGSNATSNALTGLLTDVDSVRHATLQNGAAIDFLLLAQGHGCDDFDGMCCMNLNDHSIHKSIQDLKELSRELWQNQGWDPFGLFSWLGNFGPWLRHIAGFVVIGLIALLMIMIYLPCLFPCIQRLINQSISQVMLTQTHTVLTLQSLTKKGEMQQHVISKAIGWRSAWWRSIVSWRKIQMKPASRQTAIKACMLTQ